MSQQSPKLSQLNFMKNVYAQRRDLSLWIRYVYTCVCLSMVAALQFAWLHRCLIFNHPHTYTEKAIKIKATRKTKLLRLMTIRTFVVQWNTMLCLPHRNGIQERNAEYRCSVIDLMCHLSQLLLFFNRLPCVLAADRFGNNRFSF